MTPRAPVAAVLGGAWNVREDYHGLLQICSPDVVVAVNDIGVRWDGPVDHWVSMHPGDLRRWERQRIRRYPKTWTTWSNRKPRLVDRIHTEGTEGGSGFYGQHVARHRLGLRVALCGVPMTEEPHFPESRVHQAGEPWAGRDKYWEGWVDAADELRAYCRSMSGETRRLLGAPTEEWWHG